MNEEINFKQELPEEKTPYQKYADRHSFKKRVGFQVELIKTMLGSENPDEKEQNDWYEKYGNRVSKIIDDPSKVSIRYAITNKNYKDASEMVIAILNTEDDISKDTEIHKEPDDLDLAA
jgi:hypothetical protein